jgi:hypothetical protein
MVWGNRRVNWGAFGERGDYGSGRGCGIWNGGFCGAGFVRGGRRCGKMLLVEWEFRIPDFSHFLCTCVYTIEGPDESGLPHYI